MLLMSHLNGLTIGWNWRKTTWTGNYYGIFTYRDISLVNSHSEGSFSLSMKNLYAFSVGDSLDLVPIAAFHGSGKRTGALDEWILVLFLSCWC